MKTLKQIIGRNLITNFLVHISEVSAVEDILVPYKGSICEKIFRTNPWEVKSVYVNLPMELTAKYQSVILSADYMFVSHTP